MTDQRNLLLAIVLSVAILFGWQFFIEAPRVAEQQAALEAEQAAAGENTDLEGLASTDIVDADGAIDALNGVSGAVVTRDQALEGVERVRINTESLHGSISLTGARIDDLTLARYRETLDPESPEVVLLSPLGAQEPYYADFGWLGTEGVSLPSSESVWSADRAELTVSQPVTLSWDNGAGLTFERVISVDDNYMFTITQRVTNSSGETASLAPYGRVARLYEPETLGFFILHEGPYGVFDGTLEEYSYSNLRDDQRIGHTSTGGWLGFTDKYWLAALVPEQSGTYETQFTFREEAGRQRYLATYRAAESTGIAPGATHENTVRLFAGAKVVDIIDQYGEDYGIENFDLAIDFGWFYFLTKPFFYFLDFIQGIVGNFGVAILVATVVIKLIFFPLANSSYKAMSKMKALQPEMQRLREQYPDDRQRMSQELMELYKREKVNPAAGCLPILIQIPVFFALYKVLFVNIEMRHAPFFGWIQDLSAPDPTSVFNLFGLLPYDAPTFLVLGIWPILMGLTMYLQQKLNPAPADPMQQKIFMFLPIIFTFFLASFPAGLVIYWTWNNLLSIAQQWVIMKRMGVKIGGGMEEGPSMNVKDEDKKKAETPDSKEADGSQDGKSEPQKTKEVTGNVSATKGRKGKKKTAQRSGDQSDPEPDQA